MSRSVVDALPAPPRAWRRYLVRPRSITGLLLASFALVATPLIVAIIFGVIYVDRLTDQSERLVMQGVEVTRYSKRLNSTLIEMERSARQYRVLQDEDLVARFRKQASEFDAILTALARLKMDTVPDWNLDRLHTRAQVLARGLDEGPNKTASVIKSLARMERDTELISDQGNLFVDRELARLENTAAEARTFLVLCVFALIPAVLALVAFLIFVIARPLRQISAAVTRLGDPDFSKRIKVFAPASELDTLGTRLDWMRRRLATLENEKQQFIRHMSHELKTPLASIREGTELLRDGTVGTLSAAQAEVADILQRNSIELGNLIENLLDFAAWQQHRAKLEYERFDLVALIEGIVGRQKLTIEGKQLAVKTPGTPVDIIADRDRMHLIIDNLLANAVRYSPPAGTVRIEAERLDEATAIRVADQGPGVAPEERESIFQAFYQGTASIHEHRGVSGTGIGLSVVRECVQAHGGAVKALAAVGGGALFELVIPEYDAK